MAFARHCLRTETSLEPPILSVFADNGAGCDDQGACYRSATLASVESVDYDAFVLVEVLSLFC